MLNGTHALDARQLPWCGNPNPYYTTNNWHQTTCNACLEAGAAMGKDVPKQILEQHKQTMKDLEDKKCQSQNTKPS